MQLKSAPFITDFLPDKTHKVNRLIEAYMTKYIMAVVAATVLLSACQQPVSVIPPHPVPPEQSATNVVAIRAQQYQLWNDSLLNTQSALPADTIYTNSSLLSLDWDGDGIELLSQLARQRGLQFNYSGVRLPLPLNIHVRNTTFQNTLRIIQSQTEWRATLHQYPGLIQVAFMPAATPKKHRGRQ